MTIENKGAMTATLVIAASDSLNKSAANLVCTGVNDHLAIQEALDALPATGGEVFLLDGTYNCEVQIDLDSYQTLRGCGRNTILTTSTADLVFLSAVGGAGTEKVHIVIADLQIDGGVGRVSNCGIYFEYVDYSLIQNVYSRRHNGSDYYSGVYLDNSDFNQIVNNICQENNRGICPTNSNNNTISGNTCQGNDGVGIYFFINGNNTIIGNTCQENSYGIYLVDSNSNTIIGNTCLENSQAADNTYDNIFLGGSDYNLIANNVCRQGALGNKPRYGINISDVASDKNIIQGNDLHDAGKTANFNDAGTLTIVQDDNREIDVIQYKHYIHVKNTSGSQRVAGDVVIIKGIATAVEFTTTVTQGDDKVYGMVAETIEDDASGYVLVKGFTAVLKVNGTIDIAIDDILGAFTTACIAMKAAAGDQGFALALEAYATDDSNGVIDAYIISPWD